MRLFKTTLVLLLLLSPSTVFAHPGNTAADGCHYCRTNCDKWGVAWNQRHCHNGNVPVIIPTTKVVPTRKPIPTKTLAPTPTPTAIPTEIPATPSPSPEVSPTISLQQDQQISKVKFWTKFFRFLGVNRK